MKSVLSLIISVSILVVPVIQLINSSYALKSSSMGIPNTSAVTRKFNVVTSVAPIANIIKNIGGDRIDLVGIIPEGSDSHTFELVPSDVVKIRDADLVVIDGLNLEGGMEKIVNEEKSKNPQLQLLKLGDDTISQNQWIYDFSFPKEKGDPNPHLWLNVIYAMKFANLTRDKLKEMDPENANYYSTNSEKYNLLLKKLDDAIMQVVQTVPPENRKLLTYHDSWAYFAQRYGMKVIGAVQSSDFGEPSPQDVAKLIDQIRSENVSTIFASEVFPSKIIDQIGKEGNVTFVQTLSDDVLPQQARDQNHTYVGMMLENMKKMIVPLGGNVWALKDVDPRDTFIQDG